jgi:hypothetical protein
LPADVHHHRAVAADKRREGSFAGGIAPGGEPLDELAIGQANDGGSIIKRFNLLRDGRCCHRRHFSETLARLERLSAPSLIRVVSTLNK